MKKIFVTVISVILIMIGFASCHSNVSNNAGNRDTATRTSSDTAMIPGTPGPSGSEPRPGDTTKAHRDSLKSVNNISDTTKQKTP